MTYDTEEQKKMILDAMQNLNIKVKDIGEMAAIMVPIIQGKIVKPETKEKKDK